MERPSTPTWGGFPLAVPGGEAVAFDHEGGSGMGTVGAKTCMPGRDQDGPVQGQGHQPFFCALVEEKHEGTCQQEEDLGAGVPFQVLEVFDLGRGRRIESAAIVSRITTEDLPGGSRQAFEREMRRHRGEGWGKDSEAAHRIAR